ncbi:MAG: tetratricopeptide repeat protein, partial [Deltaproteobacteria bacterium]|nr:tetratricopeptide repeat protein [Deltaproteobacteria bacterium]
MGTLSCSTHQVQSTHEGDTEEGAIEQNKGYSSSGVKTGKGSGQLKQGNKAFRDSDYKEALDHYQKALKRSQNLDNKNGMIDSLNGMGLTYLDMGQISKALQSV